MFDSHGGIMFGCTRERAAQVGVCATLGFFIGGTFATHYTSSRGEGIDVAHKLAEWTMPLGAAAGALLPTLISICKGPTQLVQKCCCVGRSALEKKED